MRIILIITIVVCLAMGALYGSMKMPEYGTYFMTVAIFNYLILER